MLVTISFMYVALLAPGSLLFLIYWDELRSYPQEETKLIHEYHHIIRTLPYLAFAYNFYVYLITGRQFRADLRQLLCARCSRISTTAQTTTEDVALNL